MIRFFSWVLILLIFITPFRVSAQMPDTGAFMAMLTTCASGASTEFDANLVGSIEKLYDGQSTRGYAKLKTHTDFLDLLPEKDKLEGYRLYTECIKTIVSNPKSNKAELQLEFLDGFDFSTTLDKVIEVFGAASKSRDGYLWFEGAEVNFFVHLDDRKYIDKIAVYASGNRDKARIPMLYMGNEIDGQGLSFYNLNDFRFKYIPQLCQENDSIGEGHARFAFVISDPCYFGKPGGYMNYVFVFQPGYSEDCDDDFLGERKKYTEYKCRSTQDLTPVMALVYPEEDFDAGDDANALMEWIYRF